MKSGSQMCRQHAKIYLCTRKPEKPARERESERDEGMGGNVAKRHSGEHKNKERPQEREQARERTKERERRMNIPCLFVTFCLFFQHFIQKQRSNGTDAPQRDAVEWDGMGWDSMLRLAELRSDR